MDTMAKEKNNMDGFVKIWEGFEIKKGNVFSTDSLMIIEELIQILLYMEVNFEYSQECNMHYVQIK